MEELSEVQGDVNLVVVESAGQGWTLPPPLRPINGVGDPVGFVRIVRQAVIAELPL